MIRAVQSWRNLIAEDCAVPLEYPDTTIHDTLRIDAQQKEADIAMEQMRQVLGVDVLGWVPNDEYQAVKEKAGEMKARILEAATTHSNVTAVQNHFPFDDFCEDS